MLAISFVAFGESVVAQPTATINYQGKLTDTNGLAVPDDTYDMRFWLLQNTSQATTSAIWTEELTGANQVQVIDGLFSVMLGSTSALTSVDFNQTLYLGVEIGGTTTTAWDGEMSPRKPLGTVPAAFESFKLGGVASTSFLRSDQADTASGLLTFTGGFISSASSTIANLTTETATTTNFVLGSDLFTSLLGTGLTNNSGSLTVSTTSLNIALSDTTGTLGVTRGGTGITSVTTGDLLYGSGANTISALNAGTNGEILQLAGGVPTWAATSSLGIVSSLFTDGGATTYLTSSDNLGIGTTSAASLLDVWGDMRVGTGSTPALFVETASESVGIGTTTPRESLDVLGNVVMDGLYFYEDGDHTNVNSKLAYSLTGTEGLRVDLGFDAPNFFTIYDSASTENIIFQAQQGNLGGNILLNPEDNVLVGTTSGQARLFVQGDAGSTNDILSVASSSGDVFFVVGADGYSGFGTTTPFAQVTVAGDLALTGNIYDENYSTGTAGYILQTTNTGVEWVATSSLGFAGVSNLEGLTDVADMTEVTGDLLSWSGSAWTNVATSTLNLDTTSISNLDISADTNLSVSATGIELSDDTIVLSAGYNIPLTASTTNWNDFYNTPSSVITAGDGIEWSSATLNVNDVTAAMLSASDFGDFTCNGTTCSLDSGVVASSSFSISNWTNGYVLQASTTATGGFDWVATSSLGITSGDTVVTVAASDTPANEAANADYVADGDRDEDTIQAAIDYAYNSGAGGEVRLLSGTFNIASSSINLATSSRLIGQGSSTILYLVDNADVPTGAGMIEANQANYTYVAHLNLQGNKANNAAGSNDGMVLINTSSSTIEFVTADNFNQMGFLVESGNHNTFFENTATNNINGYRVEDSNNSLIGNLASGNSRGIYFDSGVSSNVLRNNIISNSTSEGVYLFLADDNTIDDNTIKNNSVGIYSQLGSGNVITYNNIGDNGTNGIYLFFSSNNTLNGNNINNNGGGGVASYSIYISGNDNNVIDNIITATGTASLIFVNGSADERTTIAGNILSNPDLAEASYITDNGTDTRFDQNDRRTFTTADEVGYSLLSMRGSSSVALASTTQLGTGDIFALNNASGNVLTVANGGNVGIGTTSPYAELSIAGDVAITGALFDNNASSGESGYVLQSTGSGLAWVATSTLGISSGSSLFTDDGANTYLTSLTDNFGIGTTSTGAKLTVQGDSGDTDPIFAVASSTGSTTFTIGPNGGVELTPVGPIKVGGTDIGAAYDVYVKDKTAFVLQSTALQIYDVAQVGSISLIGSVTLGVAGNSVTIDGDYAYVGTAGGGSDNIYVVDISDLSNPTEIHSLQVSTDAIYDVEVSGGYLFAGDFSTSDDIYIYDISDPTNLVLQDSISAGASVFDLEVSGGFLYAVSTAAGDDFEIFDISDVSNILKVAGVELGDNIYSLEVVDNYAYIGTGGGNLLIYDISDPVSPSSVGSVAAVPSIAYDLKVSGNYAYVGSNGTGIGLAAIDISDPSSPFRVSGSVLSASLADMFISGNYLYTVTDGGGDDLQIFDLGGITAPSAEIGTILADSIETEDFVANAVAVETGLNVGQNALIGGALTVRGNSSTTLATDHVSFSVLDGYSGFGTTTAFSTLTVDGDLALIGDLYDSNYSTGTAGMVLQATASGVQWVATSSLGISGGGSSLFTDDGSNTYLTSLTDSFGIGTTSTGAMFTIQGNSGSTTPVFAIATSTGSTTLTIGPNGAVELLQINPVKVGQFNESDDVSSLYISGSYAYVADNDTDGLEIIDISDPTSPVKIGTVSGSVDNMYVAGDYLYTSLSTPSEFEIYDVSEPANPVLVSSSTGYEFGATEVSGGYAYIAANYDGLVIYDVSDPVNPLFVGSYTGIDGFDLARELKVVGDLVFLTQGFGAGEVLDVIDVSDPTNPIKVGGVSGNYYPGLDVANNHVFAAAYSDGLISINIASTTNPYIVGSVYDGAGIARSVEVSGNYAFLADETDGIEVIDISDPANMSIVGRFDDGGSAADLFVRGNYLYVADRTDGLEIFDLGGITAPSAEIGTILANNIETDDLRAENANIDTSLNVGQNALIGGALTVRGNSSTTINSDYTAFNVTGLFSISSTTEGGSVFDYGNAATSTILDNSAYSYTLATSTSATPIFRVDTSGTYANTLVTGGFDVANGAISYNATNNETSIENLRLGNMNFAQDAGVVSWVDMSVTASSSDGTVLSYSASLDGNELLTLHGISDGSGSVPTTSIGIGTTSPSAKLTIENTDFNGAGTVGVYQYLTTANSVDGAAQFGNRLFMNASNTATTTVVGSILRIADDTAFGNTVRGLEVQTNQGANTEGENTALSGFARTFGVRGVTSGDAGGSFEPAGGFFQTEGTTQGNAIRGFSDSITTATLLSLFQDTSDFTGTGLEMNFGNTTGDFSSTSSKYLDFQNAGTSVFTVEAFGTTTIGDGTTNNLAGLQIGYGGICVDNDGSCVAATSGTIASVATFSGNSDLAEMYFSSTDLEPGEIVVLEGGLSVDRAHQDSTTPIIGVVSTKPGVTLGFDDVSLNEDEGGFPIALSGRVPIKLSTENGPVKRGDALMLSSIPGVAMKAKGTGVVIGTALEDFDDDRMYSDTYINQFGDDMVDPVIAPVLTNTDPRINDGCYYGGGNAAGDEPCVPLEATSTEDQIEEVNEIIETESVEEALDELREIESETMTIDGGEEVQVGQIVMFVKLQERFVDEGQLAALGVLLGTSTDSEIERPNFFASEDKSLLESIIDTLTVMWERIIGNTDRNDAQELEIDQLRERVQQLEEALGTTPPEPEDQSDDETNDNGGGGGGGDTPPAGDTGSTTTSSTTEPVNDPEDTVEDDGGDTSTSTDENAGSDDEENDSVSDGGGDMTDSDEGESAESADPEEEPSEPPVEETEPAEEPEPEPDSEPDTGGDEDVV